MSLISNIRWEKWESCLRYFSGKGRCQEVCQIGKRKRDNTWVRSSQTCCCTLSGSLTYAVLILVMLLFANSDLMPSNTQPCSAKVLPKNTPKSTTTPIAITVVLVLVLVLVLVFSSH
ncbi:hypothetical protein CsSME_00020215 [Camellia sinensis var. sinensis]